MPCHLVVFTVGASMFFGTDPGPLPPWPQRTKPKIAVLIGILFVGSIFGTGVALNSDALKGLAWCLLLVLLAAIGFYAALCMLRFGYFPDTVKGRGVCRVTQPLQVWL